MRGLCARMKNCRPVESLKGCSGMFNLFLERAGLLFVASAMHVMCVGWILSSSTHLLKRSLKHAQHNVKMCQGGILHPTCAMKHKAFAARLHERASSKGSYKGPNRRKWPGHICQLTGGGGIVSGILNPGSTRWTITDLRRVGTCGIFCVIVGGICVKAREHETPTM